MLTNALKLLSGTPLHRNYDISAKPSFELGFWKIYGAVKKSVKCEDGKVKRVSIFILNKAEIVEYQKYQKKTSKTDYEEIYNYFRKEATIISRIRHPNILEVVEPLHEDRTTLFFVTEHIKASLANFGMDAFEEIEMQKGFFDVANGLQFLHESAGIIHTDLQQISIFVNQYGDWKIGRLGNAFTFNKLESQHASQSYIFQDPPIIKRSLEFTAPELVLENKASPLSDLFSLGCLIISLYNNGKTFISTNDMQMYRKSFESGWNKERFLRNVPQYLQYATSGLIDPIPLKRLKASDFQRSDFFSSPMFKALRVLDTFPENTNPEKVIFLKGFLNLIPKYPPGLLHQKVLPSLLSQLSDTTLIPYLLPCVFAISERMTDEFEFKQIVLPKILPIFKLQLSHEMIIYFLEKLEFLRKCCDMPRYISDILPLFFTTLNSKNQTVQEKALQTSKAAIKDLDSAIVKSEVFPKIAAVFRQTTHLSIKIAALGTFHSLVKQLDSLTIMDTVLPLLQGIKTKEPMVTMESMKLYAAIADNLTIESIATEVLPALWRLSNSLRLSTQQYDEISMTIDQFSQKVRFEHRRKLAASENEPKNTFNSPTTPRVDSVSFDQLTQWPQASHTPNQVSSIYNLSDVAAVDIVSMNSNATDSNTASIISNKKQTVSNIKNSCFSSSTIAAYTKSTQKVADPVATSGATISSAIDWSLAKDSLTGKRSISQARIPPPPPQIAMQAQLFDENNLYDSLI